jgi:hypothetical protein
MAVQMWAGLSILHGGLEVGCNTKTWNAPAVSVAQLDTTAVCTTGWVSMIGGLKSYTWSASLMQDFDALGLDAREYALLGAAAPTTLLPAGTTAGSLAYLLDALTLEYTPIEATVGDLAMSTLSGSGRGAAARGLLMHDLATARTSSGSGTARQLGAVAAGQRIYGALHVTAASGTAPNLVVKLQSSATEGGSYVDRVTFSAATAAGANQFASTLGAITDTWWRTNWTVSGTGPSFTFGVSAGIA